MMRINSVPGQIMIRNQTLRDILAQAYKLKEYQIKGPRWLASDHFDVSATKPPGATPDQNREMLRELLKERFHLVMRLDQADKPVYELTTVDSGIKVQPDDGLGSSFTLTWGHLVVRHAKMGEVADVLSNFVDKPVVDRTSAKQAYGFTLDWTPDEFQQEQLATALGIVDQNTLAAPGDKLPPLGTAMREQLGLRLQNGHMPIDFLIVESAARTPDAN